MADDKSPEGTESLNALKEERLGKFSHLSNLQGLEWTKAISDLPTHHDKYLFIIKFGHLSQVQNNLYELSTLMLRGEAVLIWKTLVAANGRLWKPSGQQDGNSGDAQGCLGWGSSECSFVHRWVTERRLSGWCSFCGFEKSLGELTQIWATAKMSILVMMLQSTLELQLWCNPQGIIITFKREASLV